MKLQNYDKVDFWFRSADLGNFVRFKLLILLMSGGSFVLEREQSSRLVGDSRRSSPCGAGLCYCVVFVCMRVGVGVWVVVIACMCVCVSDCTGHTGKSKRTPPVAIYVYYRGTYKHTNI